MSIHRRAAKRDSNEPQIVDRFIGHRWHVEKLSIAGMPDLLCWPTQPRLRTIAGHPAPSTCLSLSVLVDVKEPTGKPTPAQVEKWKALSEKGIPVYVARTPEDVDAIVAGTAQPWGVMEARQKRGKQPYPGPIKRAAMERAKAREARDEARRRARVPDLGAAVFAEMVKPPGQDNYEAAVGRALKAAHEAEATFAPTPRNRCRASREGDCFWGACPQEANHRANYNHAGCPLYVREDDE